MKENLDNNIDSFLINKEEKEIWKSIYLDGEKSNYECSNYGNIRNKDKKYLKPIKIPNGYYVVTLYHNKNPYRLYVHRIIAITFIKIPDGCNSNDLEVNHKNGKQKWNNSIYNLEWCTSSENKIHAYKTGLQKIGEKNVHSKYKDYQIHMVCKLIEENKLKPSEIKEKTGVSIAQINDIRNKGSWLHISSLYDFSNYTPKQIKFSSEQISKAKKLLKDGNMTCRDISNITKIPIKTIYWYKSKMK